jgi:hypothetical protein
MERGTEVRKRGKPGYQVIRGGGLAPATPPFAPPRGLPSFVRLVAGKWVKRQAAEVRLGLGLREDTGRRCFRELMDSVRLTGVFALCKTPAFALFASKTGIPATVSWVRIPPCPSELQAFCVVLA